MTAETDKIGLSEFQDHQNETDKLETSDPAQRRRAASEERKIRRHRPAIGQDASEGLIKEWNGR